jgi:hypothetical protein
LFNGPFLYMYFAFAVIGAALILIPKTQYKKFFLYGLLFGGLGDSIIALLLHLSGLIRYSNMGVTSILGIFSFWTPITWAFAFMIFFYFLPYRKSFLIPYLIIFAALNYSVGLEWKISDYLSIEASIDISHLLFLYYGI